MAFLSSYVKGSGSPGIRLVGIDLWVLEQELHHRRLTSFAGLPECSAGKSILPVDIERKISSESLHSLKISSTSSPIELHSVKPSHFKSVSMIKKEKKKEKENEREERKERRKEEKKELKAGRQAGGQTDRQAVTQAVTLAGRQSQMVV